MKTKSYTMLLIMLAGWMKQMVLNMADPLPRGQGEIVCREHLGGLLKSNRRAA